MSRFNTVSCKDSPPGIAFANTARMETLISDIRYGFRLLVHKPGTTAVAVLTLALGIGATTAIFSVVNGVLFRPLPYDAPDELVMVWQDHTRSRVNGPATEWASADNFFDWREQNEVFDGMFALGGWGPTLSGADPTGAAERRRRVS